MYILQGAYKTHLKTEHNIGLTNVVTNVEKTSVKKPKATKPELECQYCFKKYTSSTLLEKHVKVHGKSSLHLLNYFYAQRAINFSGNNGSPHPVQILEFECNFD